MSGEQGRISPMRTVRTFLNKGCSRTLFCVLNRAFEHPLRDEERASDPLSGGIVQHGYQCGMIWGSTLAAGAEAHRRFGAGPQAEASAILAARRIVESFRAQNGETNCSEIAGIDNTSSTMQMVTHFLFKGGTIACFRMAARYAPVAFREIEIALPKEHGEAPAAPVSCSAILARRMGASDAHAVMAAGLAGGIGLSGGACGALGAAIWITKMNTIREGGKLAFKSKSALELIDRFIRCTGYKFECSSIVGRKFESVADHALHVRNGGCSKIIEALGAT